MFMDTQMSVRDFLHISQCSSLSGTVGKSSSSSSSSVSRVMFVFRVYLEDGHWKASTWCCTGGILSRMESHWLGCHHHHHHHQKKKKKKSCRLNIFVIVPYAAAINFIANYFNIYAVFIHNYTWNYT